jgi:hypothetical protein
MSESAKVTAPTESPVETMSWQEANQQYLSASLAVVRAHLRRALKSSGADERVAATEQPSPERAASALSCATALEALPEPPALDVLCATFGLSPFERSVLLLCAGVELDSRFAGLCAEVHGEPQTRWPTFGLALGVLPEAHWSALSPEAPLRRWRLVEVGAGDALASSPLKIEERVLHFLTGVPPYVDERLRGYVEPVAPPRELSPSQAELARRIAGLWGGVPWGAENAEGRPAVQLTGLPGVGRRAVAAAVCAELGLGLHVLAAPDVPAAPAEREALVRLWQREAVLSASALLLDCGALEAGEAARPGSAFAEAVGGLLFLVAREPLELRRRSLRVEVERSAAAEERALWRHALGPLEARLDAGVERMIERVVEQFRLGVEGIRTVTAELAADRPATGDGLEACLWSACRTQARARLDGLAQRLVPAAVWDDLVLPEPQRAILRQMAAHLRRRATVHERWGFAARCSRGLGISALFAGPSGTGKTMAAEVLADELDLDLYRIDLSAVVSKYIGETEKNLRRVFDAAETGGAILFFDEADALFGRRGEVKDSHDRYANIEVSYLLQRMESYQGLAILTTNRKQDLDPAFLRRLRFIVQFPFPDATLRTEIWRRIFPAATPVDGLDPEKLARLNVSGGHIRNIAMAAAFLAADEGRPVAMDHLRRAAEAECAKLEKPVTEREVGGWV